LQKGHQLLVDEQCEVEFQIGKYKDNILCDVMPMDVCHILLGRPWQFDRGAVHDGKTNRYKFVKDGIRHTLVPIKEENAADASGVKALLLGGKEFIKQMDDSEVNFAVIRRPRAVILQTQISDLPEEIQEMLHEFGDIVVDDLPDELPPRRGISHYIDFIPGASLPNKVAYRNESERSRRNSETGPRTVGQGTDTGEHESLCSSNCSGPKEGRRMANVHGFQGN